MKYTIAFLLCISTMNSGAQNLYDIPVSKPSTAWFSFENPTGEKGKAAQANKGAKGNAWKTIKAGETVTLLKYKGSGSLQRIWMTLKDRSPGMLHSLRLEMYWDNAVMPAVSVPLDDFFNMSATQRTPFQNALFTSPEGRSFNCYIPMPFKKAARVVLMNGSKKRLPYFTILIYYCLNLILIVFTFMPVILTTTAQNLEMIS